MSEKYNLKSIMDIVRKVPEDRIEDCLDELCQLVRNTSAMWNQAKKACEQSGIDLTDELVKLPDAIDWIDDNLGQVTAEVKITEDGDSITLKTKL